jgi:hypothetical protein
MGYILRLCLKKPKPKQNKSQIQKIIYSMTTYSRKLQGKKTRSVVAQGWGGKRVRNQGLFPDDRNVLHLEFGGGYVTTYLSNSSD